LNQSLLPNRLQLQNAYEKLQWRFDSVTIAEIVLWSSWSRLDPRLAEILVSFLASHFTRINPYTLRIENLSSLNPQALAVMISFAKIKLKAEKKKDFSLWSTPILNGLLPATPQMFFLREGLPLPQKDVEEIETSLTPYLQWGFFAANSLVTQKNQSSKGSATLLAKDKRLKILRALLRKGKKISVNDYLSACEGKLERRTAERDLKSYSGLKIIGSTRSRLYRK